MRDKALFCLLAVCLLIGTVSADTLIARVDSTNADARLSDNSDYLSYFTLRNDAGDGVELATSPRNAPIIKAFTTTNYWDYLGRTGVIINTSGLPDDATIDSAVFGVYGYSKSNGDGSPTFGLTLFSPASNTTLVAGDYDSFGNDRIATDIAYADLVTGGYTNWTITDTDVIDVTGFTRIMVRDSWDIDNTTTGLTWGGSMVFTGYSIYDSSESGDTKDPFLQIEYTTGDTTPPASITELANATTCNSVNFTWTNPTDEDFNGTQYWLNNTLQNPNLTNTTTFKLVEGLSEGLSVEFASKTFDNVSNINATFKNMTAITKTSPTASFTKIKTLVVFPSSITFTDTSTGTTISGWSWDMGDGRIAITTQSPTYQYLQRGLFKVVLTATNVCGNDASDAQYVWVTGFPMFAQVSPYKNISYYYSLEDATFSSSRELSEQETLTVLRNMYGV